VGFRAAGPECAPHHQAGHCYCAFIDEVYEKQSAQALDAAFTEIWKRRVPKRQAMGIHGILFYECEHKKVYYPTHRDEEAVNPNGSRLR
jgi:hypothetical protein